MVLAHVSRVSRRTDDLLENTLATRGGTDVVQTEDGADHGGHRGKSGILTEANLGTDAVVEVRLVGSVKAHLLGVREGSCVTVCLGLKDVSRMRSLTNML